MTVIYPSAMGKGKLAVSQFGKVSGPFSDATQMRNRELIECVSFTIQVQPASGTAAFPNTPSGELGDCSDLSYKG